MAIEKGIDWMFRFETAGAVLTAVTSQENLDLELTTDMIDTTGKNTSSNKTYLGGLHDRKITLTGAYVTDDTGFAAMMEAEENGTISDISITRTDGKTWTGDGLVSSIKLGAPLDGKVTFSCEIQITNGLTRT